MPQGVTKQQRAQLEPLLRRAGAEDVSEYLQALGSTDADWLLGELAYPQFRKHDGEWVVIGPVKRIQIGSITVHKKDGTQTTVQVKRIDKSFQHLGHEMTRGFLK